jgi:hypothetical protein
LICRSRTFDIDTPLKSLGFGLLRLTASIASAVLYVVVLLPAGIAMLLAYICLFLCVAALVVAGITKVLGPHLHVYPEVEAAGFLFLAAAGIFVFVQFGLFLNNRLRAAMLRWTALGPEVRDQAPDQLKFDGQRPWR